MKTIKLEVYLTIGYSNASHEDIIEFEVDDNATEKEIEDLKEEATKEWAHNYIEFGYKEIN